MISVLIKFAYMSFRALELIRSLVGSVYLGLKSSEERIDYIC
jgi:hypothetical protein